MYYYATLNAKGIVEGISSLEILLENNEGLVRIETEDYSLLGLWYDSSDGTFKTPPFRVLAEHSTDEINYKQTDDSLSGVLDGKADVIHTHAISAVENLQTALDGKASADHTHSQYASSTHTHDYATSNHTHSQYAESSHTHEYLPTAGGTMSGAATFSNSGTQVRKSANDGSLVVSGGTDTTSSYLQLNGKGTSGSIGFSLAAHDGTTRRQFLGYKNGGLMWDDKNIVRSVNNVNADTTGNVTLPLNFLPTTGGTVSGEVNFSGGLVKAKGNQAFYATDTRLTLGTNNLETYIVGDAIFSRVAITVASDERLKENIKPFDTKKLVDFISKLEIVDYQYKGDAKKHIGVIAQQVQKADEEVAERLVYLADDGYLQVSFSELVFPLIAAVQNLQKRVEELEKGK